MYQGRVVTAIDRVEVNPVNVNQRVVGYTAPTAPERVSVLARPVAVGEVHAPPAMVVQRTVIARNAPPPPPGQFRGAAGSAAAERGTSAG